MLFFNCSLSCKDMYPHVCEYGLEKKKVIERRAIENNSKPRNFNITSQTFLYESVIKQAKLNIC